MMFAYSWFQVERKWVIWDIFGLTLQSQPYDSKQNIYLKHWKCSISEEIDCIQRRKVCHERMSMETWCWTPAEYKYRKPVWQYQLTWEVTMPHFKVLRCVKKASLLWSGLLYWQQYSQYIYQKQRLLHFVHKDFGAGAVYKQQNNPKVQDAGLNNNLQ